eukprot:TRINITY_DN10990_c0_g1_i4.p1 TRINITY_DN10990_c0_g1~~TRINITY_DN10990_c0_g1_i4.p1  ORF type:complete len:357 (+),score=49.19 TRINITY_DN10990_c0_g1_i4:568-1638(+)
MQFSVCARITLGGDWGRLMDISVMKRPEVEEFIRRMCGIYEVVLYTAAMENYGAKVIERLDPERLIPYILFRNKCSMVKGRLVKSLAHLGRDLKDVVIVDNSPSCYALQPCNGIPIKSWIDDKEDKELEKLVLVLELLSKVDDVRDYLRELVIDNRIDYADAVRLLRGETQIARPELESRPEFGAARESPKRSQSLLYLPKINEDIDGESKISPLKTQSRTLNSFPDKDSWPLSVRCKSGSADSEISELIFTVREELEDKDTRENSTQKSLARNSTDSCSTASSEDLTRISLDLRYLHCMNRIPKLVDELFEYEKGRRNSLKEPGQRYSENFSYRGSAKMDTFCYEKNNNYAEQKY